ncbi:MAG: ExbD/TolR family protein [Pirellulales bacterium]
MPVTIKKGNALGLLNLTPIIDIVFNLLIFFMVVTKFEEEERSLEVALPQASQAMPMVSKPKEFFVNINENGQYYVGGGFVDSGELETRLRQAAADNPGRQTVVIRADKHCVWQYVVTVMDLCNKVSIRDYRVTTAAAE